MYVSEHSLTKVKMYQTLDPMHYVKGKTTGGCRLTT